MATTIIASKLSWNISLRGGGVKFFASLNTSVDVIRVPKTHTSGTASRYGLGHGSGSDSLK